jgi:hypothetical protein
MSGPWGDDPISIYGTGTGARQRRPSDREPELFVLLVAHQRESKANRCRTCAKPHPCQTNRDARRLLADAGVDLDQALGTIWS